MRITEILCEHAMNQLYNQDAPKKPTNVSINNDLLSKARELKINLSATLEKGLEKQLRLAAKERWLKENKQAIEALNQLAEDKGLFSDSFRDF